MSTQARPLRRDAEENRRRLLEAASAAIAEHGFEVTMDEIAARAGVGVGTAYRRFANKEELIFALFEHRVAELVAIADRALAETDPWQAIVTFLEGSVELNAADRGIKELVFGSPRARELVDSARAQLKPRVEELVARGHAAGVLREGVAATDVVVAQMMLSSLSGPETQPWRRFLPVVLEGLRGGAGREPMPGRALSVPELDLVLGHAGGRRG